MANIYVSAQNRSAISRRNFNTSLNKIKLPKKKLMLSNSFKNKFFYNGIGMLIESIFTLILTVINDF